MVKYLLAVALTVASQLSAGYLSIGFSGTWANTAGAAKAGESFAGTASWNDDGIAPDFTGYLLTVFSLTTFPDWHDMNVYYSNGTPQESLDRFIYTNSLSGCDSGRRGPAWEYLLMVRPEKISLICRDGQPLSLVATAENYQFSMTGVAATEVHTPEPRYAALLLFAILIICMQASALLRTPSQRIGKS